MTEPRPHFRIVCDHNGRGRRHHVAWFPWWPLSGHWWPLAATEGRDGATVNLMSGNDLAAFDPKSTNRFWAGNGDDPGERDHHEIACRAEGCTEWAFRCDDTELQALFRAIATDELLVAVFPAVDGVIVMTVAELHRVRDTANK